MNLRDAPDVMTVAELAAVLRCGRNQAYQLVASGTVRSAKVGRAIRVPKSAVERFLAEGGER